MGERTVAKCVLKVCRAINLVLPTMVMPVPTTAIWKKNASDFMEKMKFPNCVAAVDGKHCHIVAPARSGSMYHNYKQTKSIVLLGFVDASYRFVAANVGAYGKNSDSGIFPRSTIGQRFESGEMNLPEPSLLPGSDIMAPYTMVGDEAFPLTNYLLRPYPGVQSQADPSKANYNHRLSQARRIVENAFGILAQRFRLFMSPIMLSPLRVNIIVMASILLHNFLNPNTFQVDPQDSMGFAPSPPVPQDHRTNTQRQRDNIAIRENMSCYLDDH